VPLPVVHRADRQGRQRRTRQRRPVPGPRPGAAGRRAHWYSSGVQQPWYIQVDADGRTGIGDLLKQLIRARLPVATDQMFKQLAFCCHCLVRTTGVRQLRRYRRSRTVTQETYAGVVIWIQAATGAARTSLKRKRSAHRSEWTASFEAPGLLRLISAPGRRRGRVTIITYVPRICL
jgi:hypothetical protein